MNRGNNETENKKSKHVTTTDKSKTQIINKETVRMPRHSNQRSLVIGHFGSSPKMTAHNVQSEGVEVRRESDGKCQGLSTNANESSVLFCSSHFGSSREPLRLENNQEVQPK